MLPAPVGTDWTHPQVGVGVIVRRGEELLLIQRGRSPGLGQWSIPGGRQEPGETIFATAVREVLEETGVTIRPLRVLTAVDSISRDADGRLLFHYTVIEVEADWLSGEPVPNEEVLAARWATRPEWETLITWPPLRAVLLQAFDAVPANRA